MIGVAHALLALLAIPTLFACGYLLLLALLSARLPLPTPSSRRLRFDVIVAAHNESAVIAKCLASLRQLDWPPQHFRILVVADNCDDATASIARDANALVLERNDARRGKGYALQFAFDYSRESCQADAVVIVDADTQVSRNLLEAFAARIEQGAGVVQAHYGVLNPAESWRTGLMAIAHGAFHGVRSLARERMRVSCGLRGNGWCVTHRTLDAVPYRAFSVTEDLEYGIALGLAGHRVHYAGEASANAVMESRGDIAGRQRQRWEDGRLDLVRSRTLPLLMAAARKRSLVCLDLALDLLVPPLSWIALGVAILLGAGTIAGAAGALCLILYVLRGWQLSGRGAAGLVDLLRAPFFVIWKLLLIARPRDRHVWAPTPRKIP